MAQKFEDFGLDRRLQQALTSVGFEEPTPIQAEAIPLALNEQRDIVARAQTGSGKTLAYLIPIIQKLLLQKTEGTDESEKALILVPSKELAQQVMKSVQSLTTYCNRDIKAVNVAQSVNDTVVSSLLRENPAIIVATPSRALKFIEDESLKHDKIRYLVIDEADLITSYGYQEDLQLLSSLLKGLPLQTWLMSATLGEDVEQMKKLFCFFKIAVLKLEQEAGAEQRIKQYYVKCSELDKFLLAYVIFKLKLIKGKTIIFVNDIDRCYRLKLFLEQFGIKSCVLNSELPIPSRLHIVDEFNRGVYNLLIATDENLQFEKDEEDEPEEAKTEETAEDKAEGEAEDQSKTEDNNDETNDDTKETASQTKSKNKNKRKRDAEYGVSRGVDFVNVNCVLNFDLPTSSKSYTHRIGRTARANKTGMALSFVVPAEEWGKHKPSSFPTAKRDEKVLRRVIRTQEKLNNVIEPYSFDMKQVESFRYRMDDAFRAVTKVAVREARVKEIRQELLASEKLKRHFEENPADLASLRHDKELHSARTQAHLKRVPEYLLPKGSGTPAPKPLQVSFHKKNNRNHKVHKSKKPRKKDPLKTFRR